ncbi:protein IMPACT isoform X3 [Dromiciops gliroides]|uniref:protein IMPACT isoform X3 n=1 Tax=Dromiciops gliroides TaxID=33562 RepID=UPI001CC42E06|nr:protein IMPACT isoform X3 [Dromiciops gliroides]
MAAAESDSSQRQIEEIEALSSIYGDEWCVIDEATRIFCIKISDNLEIQNGHFAYSAPWLREQDRVEIANGLEEIYVQNIGESILYLWVEKIREVLIEKSQLSESGPNIKKTTEEEDADNEDDCFFDYQSKNTIEVLDFVITESQSDVEELPPIKHGVPITDRRSTFQAHLAPVVFLKQVKMVLAKLYENKKIANATHNIYAYRTVKMMVKQQQVDVSFTLCRF